MKLSATTRTADETHALGRRIGALLRAGDVVVLEGELGTGKTVFAKGIAVGLGVREPVVSPTFTVVRAYDAPTPRDHLAAIAVGTGPGLFTGLRVGVTTAKVMAQALRIPVVGIPSLDLVAYPLRHTDRTIVAVLDARRHEVFAARYRPVPGGVQRVS